MLRYAHLLKEPEVTLSSCFFTKLVKASMLPGMLFDLKEQEWILYIHSAMHLKVKQILIMPLNQKLLACVKIWTDVGYELSWLLCSITLNLEDLAIQHIDIFMNLVSHIKERMWACQLDTHSAIYFKLALGNHYYMTGSSSQSYK